MNQSSYLIAILEKSIEKNGNQPLTTQYLLNLLKLSNEFERKEYERKERLMDEAYMKIYTDQCGDRS